MYPLDKTIYAGISHMKKREREKEVTVSLLVGLPFIWVSLEICSFFLLNFFFSSRNALYQKVWTNGPSRCLGHLSAHLFICVGPVGPCAVCGPQILPTLGRKVLLTENRESVLHSADRTPVLLPFSLCVADV